MTKQGQEYIEGVIAGKVVASKWVRLAVERHINDVKKEIKKSFLFHYDKHLAIDAVEFIELLTHTKGDCAGKQFILEPWQHFFVCSIFGWVRKADGKRRFRKAYMTVARKNGKTQLAAGIMLKCLIADGEAGAEIYSAATKRDQAKIVWDEAARMIKANSTLSNYAHVWKGTSTITVELSGSKFLPLSSEAKTLDGLNPHAATIDEYHAHPSNEVIEVIDTGMGARSQPLLLITTTAGYDINSPCVEEDKYCQDVLQGVLENDAYFGIIYRPDDADEWTSQTAVLKANPNFGISVQPNYIQDKFAQALSSARMTNDVKVKNLNIWCQTVTRWILDEAWMACKRDFTEEDLAGRKCVMSFDLSASQDITAILLDFLPLNENEPHYFVTRFFIPGDNVTERERLDKFPYQECIDKGLIIATPGDVIDYDFIEDEIRLLCKTFEVIECAYDPWKAQEIVNHITEEGIIPVMVPMFMRYSSMAAPTDAFEKDVLSKKIAHDGNKVLRWMLTNTEVKSDRQGNIMPMKPRRETTGKRIDGIVAAIMAHGRAVMTDKSGSVYEERGILML